MHERKMTMAEMSAGAIALPGGVGTMDELFEIITWRQLGLYAGSVVIANVGGFYDNLLAHLQGAATATSAGTRIVERGDHSRRGDPESSRTPGAHHIGKILALADEVRTVRILLSLSGSIRS